MWTVIEQIIKNPPLWVLTIVVAVLVSHALRVPIRLILGRRKTDLITILELIVVFVLLFLSIHLVIQKFVRDRPVPWHEEPLSVACLLVLFAVMSMAIYMFFRFGTEGKGAGPSSRRKAPRDEDAKRRKERI